MKKANISTLKNELSRYLKWVRQGERVRIMDRDTPIADIVPVQNVSNSRLDPTLKSLEDKGILRLSLAKVTNELLEPPSQSENSKEGIVEALLKNRNEDR